MSSPQTDIKDFESYTTYTETALPPVICMNLRQLIGPDKVDVIDIELKPTVKRMRSASLVKYPAPNSREPIPRFPLSLVWCPQKLYFDIKEDVVINKLSIWNSTARPLYFQFCGLWNERGGLGASWWCYPKTRFYLAPGLKSELNIKAAPKYQSPMKCANVGLQIAAAHTRDNVTGYFVVPIIVRFYNYLPPCLGEVE